MRKKILSCLLIFVLCFSLFGVSPLKVKADDDPVFWTTGITTSSQYPFGGGDGSSEEQAFEIATPQQLAQLAYNVNTGVSNYLNQHFKLMDNIDLSGKQWEPIALNFNRRFMGTFNGNGQKVYGLTITEHSNTTAYGLFGFLALQGSVKNLTIESGSIAFSDNPDLGTICFGTIVGQNYGRVDNCINKINITIQDNNHNWLYAGGIVGMGFAGYFGEPGTSTVSNSHNYGNITIGNIGSVGGIVGEQSGNENTYIKNCSNRGNILGGDHAEAGGIVGRIGAAYALGVYNCYNTGSVTSGSPETNSSSSGGIVGYLYTSLITNCYNSGIITVLYGQEGNTFAGGIAGHGYGRMVNNYNVGAVSGSPNLTGGIWGYTDHHGPFIMNNYYLDSSAPGTPPAAGQQSLTEAQMKGIAQAAITFKDSDGDVNCGPSNGAFLYALNGGRYAADNAHTDLWTWASDDGNTNNGFPVFNYNNQSYIVSYETAGGSPVPARTVGIGQTILGAPTTVKEGYIFNGWFTQAAGGSMIAFPYTPTGHVTLYAQWSLDTFPAEVWVDDDYTTSTPGWQETRFATIQKGVDAVAEGGTVNVAAGTYHGTAIDKQGLILRGQPGAAVDGQGLNGSPGFMVTKPGVSIEGFAIRNWDGAAVLLTGARTAHNSIIQNNTITNNHQGILAYTNGNLILNNTISGSGDNGIALYGTGNRVEGNTVNNNTKNGIYVNGNLHLITNNNLSGNGVLGSWIAAIFVEGDHNTVSSNTANNNQRIGIRILGNDNTVENNSASHNGFNGGWRGIHAEGSDNRITGNTVNGNNSDGIELDSESSGFLIENNTVLNNRDNGIRVRGENHTIKGNTAAENGHSGINMNTRDSDSSVLNNIISDNLEYGIYSRGLNFISGNTVSGNGNLEDERGGGILAASGDTVYANKIFGNHNYGVFTYLGWEGEDGGQGQNPEADVEPIIAVLNWWGHASGPLQERDNPYGSGDAVAYHINFSPWLLSAESSAEPVATKTDYLNQGETIEIDGAVSATVLQGSGIVTVGKYGSNPAAQTIYGSAGRYVDVFVTSPHNIDELLVKLFYEGTPEGESEFVMHWWDGSDWVTCSNTGVNTAEKYVWAIIGSDSSPSLDDLTGTEFGAGLVEPGEPGLPITGAVNTGIFAGILALGAGALMLRKKRM